MKRTKRCPRCGGEYRFPSCGKTVHETLPLQSVEVRPVTVGDHTLYEFTYEGRTHTVDLMALPLIEAEYDITFTKEPPRED